MRRIPWILAGVLAFPGCVVAKVHVEKDLDENRTRIQVKLNASQIPDASAIAAVVLASHRIPQEVDREGSADGRRCERQLLRAGDSLCFVKVRSGTFAMIAHPDQRPDVMFIIVQAVQAVEAGS